MSISLSAIRPRKKNSRAALAQFAAPIILSLFLALVCLTWPCPQSVSAAGMPVPEGLFKKGITPDSPADVLLTTFLGIPYRNDGAIDEHGRYTLFAQPDKTFATPGLNCSGLVLEASRFLLGKNFTLAEVKRDRLGDSGPGSPHGEDWDFGWDIIMNISEGLQRSLLLPGGKNQDPATATGFAPRGFDMHSDATWSELPGRLRRGCLYLVSINVEGRRKGYGLQHYHVGLILVDRAGKAWFYQTTGSGKTANRRDVTSESGRASLKRAFANKGNQKRMMLVLEVALPQSRR